MDSGTAIPPKLSGHRFDVSMLLVNFHGDGAQRVFLHLSEVFVRHGLRVEIIALNPGGRLRQYVSDGVRVVVLDCHVPDPNAEVPLASRILPLQADPSSLFQLARPVLLAQKTYPELNYLPDLVQKLRTSRPRAVVSALPQVNVLAVWASRLVHPRPRVVVIEHSVHTAAQRKKRFKRWFKRFQPRLIGRTYRLADAVVSVSNGVADDVTAFTGFPRERIQTIYNPVVPANVQELAGKAVCHPWFVSGEPPVILAAGRLHQLKDFPTLMRAFARVRERRLARLVIFGESEHGDTAEAQHALMNSRANSVSQMTCHSPDGRQICSPTWRAPPCLRCPPAGKAYLLF